MSTKLGTTPIYSSELELKAMKTTQERTHNENRHCRQKTPHDVCESDIIICIKTS